MGAMASALYEFRLVRRMKHRRAFFFVLFQSVAAVTPATRGHPSTHNAYVGLHSKRRLRCSAPLIHVACRAGSVPGRSHRTSPLAGICVRCSCGKRGSKAVTETFMKQ